MLELGSLHLDHPPDLHARALEERVEAAGKLWQMVAGYLRVEVMLKVIRQFE